MVVMVMMCLTSQWLLMLSVTGGVNGGNNNDTFNVNQSIVANLNGDGGNDTFTINFAAAAQAVTGNIDGGTGNDLFDFDAFGRVTGNVNGQAGTDTLDYSGTSLTTTTAIAGGGTIDGSRGSITSAPNNMIGGTFDNINNLTANATMAALQGPNLDTIWNVTNVNLGTFGVIGTETMFNNFAIVGGTMGR